MVFGWFGWIRILETTEFHAVHRVGVKRQVGEYLDHPNGPKQYKRQIIMRFVNR